MSKGLFQNPRKALLFVGATLFSVAMLIGSEDDKGALVQAAATLEQQDRRVDGQLPPDFGLERPTPAQFDYDEPADVSLAEDAALVDDTAGFDPTPPDEQPEDHDPAKGDTYVVVEKSGL